MLPSNFTSKDANSLKVAIVRSRLDAIQNSKEKKMKLIQDQRKTSLRMAFFPQEFLTTREQV